MSVFIFDKDSAKLYVQFLDQNHPYIRDFVAVQKTRSRVNKPRVLKPDNTVKLRLVF